MKGQNITDQPTAANTLLEEFVALGAVLSIEHKHNLGIVATLDIHGTKVSGMHSGSVVGAVQNLSLVLVDNACKQYVIEARKP